MNREIHVKLSHKKIIKLLPDIRQFGVIRHLNIRFLCDALVIIILMFLTAFPNYGQVQEIEIGSILMQKLKEIDNLITSPSASKELNPSWIEKLDLRTETNDFELKEQRYSLRITPSSRKIRQSQSQLYQLYQAEANLETKKLKRKLIDQTYEDIIKLYEYTTELTLQEERLLILKDKALIYEKFSTRDTKYVEDWIKAQRDIADLEIDLTTIKTAIAYLTPESNGKINWKKWIEVAKIPLLISGNNPKAFALSKKEHSLTTALINSEIQLEKAEHKKIFDFFQVEYKGATDNPFQEQVSLGAAFSLPFSGNQKLKLEELQLEKAILGQEEKIKGQIRKDALKRCQERVNQHWQSFTKSLQVLEQENTQFNKVKNNQNQHAVGSPILVLALKENILKRKLDLLNREMKLYQAYLEYLSLSEQLYKNQSMNFFIQ